MSEYERIIDVEELNSEHAIVIQEDETLRLGVDESPSLTIGTIDESENSYKFKMESEEDTVGVTLDESIKIEIIYDADLYDGAYEVTPSTSDAIILQTKKKMMKDDVTVKKIPYFETHNDYGETIYIGSEI